MKGLIIVFKNIFITLLYFCGARLGLLLMFGESNATPVWPPSGVAMALVLIMGYKILPGIFLGAFFANFITFKDNNTLTLSFFMSMFIAMGNSFEAYIGKKLLTLSKSAHNTFSNIKSAFKFIFLCGLIAPLSSAIIGTFTISISGVITPKTFYYVFTTWWTGDVTSILLLVPIIILWIKNRRVSIEYKQIPEMLVVFTILVIISLFVFIYPLRNVFKDLHELRYLPIPFILWGIFRFHKHIAMTFLLMINIFAVWGVLLESNKLSYFFNTELLYLQLYLATLSILSIIFMVTITEQKAFRAKLLSSQEKLMIQIAKLEQSKDKEEKTQRDLERNIQKLELSRKSALSIMQDANNQKKRVQEIMKKLEQSNLELQLEKEKSDIANKAKSVFLANMSHEIRTPMNAILGFSEILKEREQVPEHKHYINIICTSGKALLSLINDILDLSKIESGRMELNYSVVSIKSLLKEFEAMFSHKVKTLGLAFNIKCDTAVPEYIFIDELRLRQIFINILGNAFKFTKKGFIDVTITSNFPNIQNRVNLTINIEDSGIGIPSNDLQYVFDSFAQVQGHDGKEYGGSGLGLAITKKIVDLMKGEISVVSKEEVGSTFTVYLPGVEVYEGDNDLVKVTSLDSNKVHFEPAKILIADDIEYNREIIKTYLSSWKFTFIEAENGVETIHKAIKEIPDLIILDIKMPIMNGYEASKKIKDNPITQNIPIIAVTASAFEQDKKVILENCNEYIRKPVSRDDLVRKIKNYLKHSILIDHNQDAIDLSSIILPSKKILDKLVSFIINGDIYGLKTECNSLKTKQDISLFIGKVIQLADSFKMKELEKLLEEALHGGNK